MNATQTTFRRNCLGSLIALALIQASSVALAGTVAPGMSHTIRPGDVEETWSVGDGSSLIMTPGSQAISISGRSTSQISIDGGIVTTGRTSGNPNGWAAVFGGRDGAGLVNISGGSVITGASGISLLGGTDLSNGRLQITGSTVVGTESRGILQGAGNSIVTGSQVIGQTVGLAIISHFNASEIISRNSIATIDSSIIRGITGSAINVGMSEGYDPGRANSVITVQNGSQLIGDNGVALEVINGSVVDFTIDSSDIVGDVFVSNTATADVTLRNNGTLLGKITNAANLGLQTGGRWTLTGDSDVGALELGAGAMVALGNGSTFNTLEVTGDFVGSGGTLLFNSVLGDDSSITDKLIINGNTSGQARVAINNVGGAGTQTINGIKLIQVDGVSDGRFDLAGRAVGGLYDYFLFKGSKSDPSDGNWYLRSELQTPPNPCLADPTLPGCEVVIPDPCEIDPSLPQCGPVVPVLRPEPGAYLANLRAAEMMFRTDYHSRHDGQNNGRAWARVDGNRNSYDALNRQLDISGNSQALHVGMDLMTNDAGSGFGVMLASGNATSTTKSNLTDYSARGKVRGEALGVYGTLRALSGEDAYAGLYVDGWVQRQQFRNKVEGAGLASERYDSKAWQGAVEAGYAFRLSGNAVPGGLYLEPQVQVGYTDITSETHVEANGTTVEAREAGGLFTRTGLRLSGVMSWERAAAQVQPYLQANWLYNKRDEALLFDNELVDNRIPASKLEIGGGASIKFAGGLSAWAGLAVQSTSGYRSTSAQLGVSYSW